MFLFSSPNFEEFKPCLISETPCSSRRILVTSVSFSRFSCYWGYRNFRWFFQIALHNATRGSKTHGLQLKEGNCFIRAPVLLACTTKGKGREHTESLCGFVPMSSLSQLCSDKPGCTSLPGKSSFSGNSPLPATKERVTIFLTSHFKARQ